jgi:hypothetical protein
MITYNTTTWSEWDDDTSMCAVSYSDCGKYIAKRYYSVENMEDARDAQLYAAVSYHDMAPKVYKGIRGFDETTYVSERVDTIRDTEAGYALSEWLFDACRVGDPAQWIDYSRTDDLVSFKQLAWINVKDQKGVTSPEFHAAWDFILDSVEFYHEVLAFGDAHWLNYGRNSAGHIVCIDWDTANNIALADEQEQYA